MKENKVQDRDREEFVNLRKQLMECLENTWEESDQGVMENIDSLIGDYCRTTYMPISRREALRRDLFSSVRKMDVLEELLEDDTITEIMVNRWDKIFIEKDGKIFPLDKTFSSPEKLDDVIQQMASRCNRVINTLQPIVDARLKNGERINAVIAPVALDGPILTIRRFPNEPITMEKLLEMDSLTKEAAEVLKVLIRAGYTILIGGDNSIIGLSQMTFRKKRVAKT